jgi:hypothetical protein
LRRGSDDSSRIDTFGDFNGCNSLRIKCLFSSPTPNELEKKSSMVYNVAG